MALDVFEINEYLSIQLYNKHLSSKNIKDCLYKVFHRLYFLDNIVSAYNSPIEAYGVLQFLAYQFITLRECTYPYFGSLQTLQKFNCSMHLRISDQFMKINQLCFKGLNQKWVDMKDNFVQAFDTGLTLL